MADFPAPAEGIVLTHFLVSDDVDRSRAFYTEVLGGEALMDGEPTIVALANSWIIINTGGGPTDDKPSITLASTPHVRTADLSPVPAATLRTTAASGNRSVLIAGPRPGDP